MVRYKAHNLGTDNACVGSIPTPATMKKLNDYIINENSNVTYKVAISSITDNEGLPITVTMSVDSAYRKEFEKWLDSQIENEFSAANSTDGHYQK